MKKILTLLMILLTVNLSAQIDLSCDASFVGVYPSAKISYPLFDRVIIGGSYGYNITNNLELTHRYGIVIGVKFDEWVQLELDFGFNRVAESSQFLNRPSLYENYGQHLPQIGNKHYSFHAAFGLKYNFCNNLFVSMQVGWPGFIKVGLGIRLRPYKKLTVWDKQN